MNLQNCLHPRVVTNKYSGEQTVVSCGRCSACLNNRALTMTTRCDLESQSHKFCVFATLTYADNDVPQIVRLRSCDLSSPNDIVYLDSSTGEYFDFHDKSVKRHRQSDYQFCQDTKVLPILSKSDFQKFIKLVRYYANKVENGVKLRYFLTGEYGPSTYRPHGHLLLWFDSESLVPCIKEILRKSWSHGLLYDPHFVSGSASSYVASYVNSISKLPSIYTHKGLRPFSLFSKCPALGTLSTSIPSLRDVLTRGLSKFTFCPPEGKSFVDVSFWRSLSDRFCPRIQRFSSLSVADRVALYGLVDKYDFENDSKFAEFLYFRYIRGIKQPASFIASYLYEICHHCVKRSKFSKGDLIKQDYFDLKTCFNSLVRFCSVIRRAKLTAQQLEMSLSDYVKLISSYYESVNVTKFKDYLKFQDEYFKQHPIRDYLLFDYAFVQRVNGKDVATLSTSDRHYLSLCGVIDDSTKVVFLSLSDCLEYHHFVARSNLLAEHLVKNKVQFDYVLSQGDAFLNVKNYFHNEQ